MLTGYMIGIVRRIESVIINTAARTSTAQVVSTMGGNANPHNRVNISGYSHPYSAIAFLLLILCLLSSTATAMERATFHVAKDATAIQQKCDASVKSYAAKSRASPYVFLTKQLRSVRTAVDRNRYNSTGFYYAIFEILDVIKEPPRATPGLLSANKLQIQVPYDRGNSDYSRERFCLTKFHLRQSRILFLFLTYNHRNNSWSSIFLPSTVESITRSRILINSSESSLLGNIIMSETPIIPLYEITIDPGSSGEQHSAKLAKISEGESFLLRCSVAPGHSLSDIAWIRSGQPIDHDSSVTLISEKASSSYHFSSFNESHQGLYECRAQDSTTTNFHSARLRLKLKETTRSIALRAGQKECTGNRATGHCLNGGQCFLHADTGHYGCFCRSMFYGNYCQHKATIGKPIPSIGPTTSHFNQTVGLMAICLALSFLVLTCVAIGLVHYTRYRKRQRKFTDAEISSLCENSSKPLMPALVIDGATPKLFGAVTTECLTCPHCGWSGNMTNQRFFPNDTPALTTSNDETGTRLPSGLDPHMIPVSIRKLSAPPGCPPVITVQSKDYDPRCLGCPDAFKRYSLQSRRPVAHTNSRERRLGVSEAHLDDLLAEPLPEDIRDNSAATNTDVCVPKERQSSSRGSTAGIRKQERVHSDENGDEMSPLAASCVHDVRESSC